MNLTNAISNASYVAKTSSDVISGTEIWSVEHPILTSLVLGIIILCTVIGNVFVIAAVIREKTLKYVGNFLIVSLAVSDLMLALLVMPVAVVNEVTERWSLGSVVCNIWTSMDLLCCGASIFSLLTIAIDRYLTVTSIDYIRKRAAKHILAMVTAVWLVSAMISISPVLIFKNDNDVTVTGVCVISQDTSFTIFSTVALFHLPLFVLIIIYAKIFIALRERIRRRKFSNPYQFQVEQLNDGVQIVGQEVTDSQNIGSISRNDLSLKTLTSVSGSETDLPAKKFNERDKRERAQNDKERFTVIKYQLKASTEGLDTLSKHTREVLDAKKNKKKLKKKREKKLALTLIIITGAFVICWMPYIIVVTIANFSLPELIAGPWFSTVYWIGCCNSLLNPIIYTVFNEEFRKAFKNLISRKCFQRQSRNSTKKVHEQRHKCDVKEP